MSTLLVAGRGSWISVQDGESIGAQLIGRNNITGIGNAGRWIFDLSGLVEGIGAE